MKKASLRLPVTLLDRIKVTANKRDVPQQSLIQTWLAETTLGGWGFPPPPPCGRNMPRIAGRLRALRAT